MTPGVKAAPWKRPLLGSGSVNMFPWQRIPRINSRTSGGNILYCCVRVILHENAFKKTLPRNRRLRNTSLTTFIRLSAAMSLYHKMFFGCVWVFVAVWTYLPNRSVVMHLSSALLWFNYSGFQASCRNNIKYGSNYVPNFISLASLLWKNKMRLMWSPCWLLVSLPTCLSLRPSMSLFLSRCPPSFLATRLMRSACYLSVCPILPLLGNGSSVCQCLSLRFSFSIWSVSYQEGLWDQVAVCVSLSPKFFDFFTVRLISEEVLVYFRVLCRPCRIKITYKVT
jgi:hypothetical protein